MKRLSKSTMKMYELDKNEANNKNFVEKDKKEEERKKQKNEKSVIWIRPS